MHPIVKKILSHDLYVPSKRKKSISASSFGNSVQEIILSKRYKSTTDIKLNCASLLGTGFHLFSEQAVKPGYEFELNDERWRVYGCEKSMETPIGKTGWWLTGTSDLLVENLSNLKIRVYDYKTVKDYGLANNLEKWTIQVGIYALLVKLSLNLRVDNKSTVVYFNKTNEAASKFAMGYVDLQLPSPEILKKIVLDKVALLEKYWDVPDDKLICCTNKENWNYNKCRSYCHVANSKHCHQINSIIENQDQYNYQIP